MTRADASAGHPGTAEAKARHGNRKGRARHMQTVAYSRPMQYATLK